MCAALVLPALEALDVWLPRTLPLQQVLELLERHPKLVNVSVEAYPRFPWALGIPGSDASLPRTTRLTRSRSEFPGLTADVAFALLRRVPEPGDVIMRDVPGCGLPELFKLATDFPAVQSICLRAALPRHIVDAASVLFLVQQMSRLRILDLPRHCLAQDCKEKLAATLGMRAPPTARHCVVRSRSTSLDVTVI